MGYRCLACAKVSARTWTTVVRRCGWPGGYEAADAADASTASAARIGIPLTERLVGWRSGLANGLHNTIDVSLTCISARVTNFTSLATFPLKIPHASPLFP